MINEKSIRIYSPDQFELRHRPTDFNIETYGILHNRHNHRIHHHQTRHGDTCSQDLHNVQIIRSM